MSDPSWPDWVSDQERGIRAEGQWREMRPLEGAGPGFRLADGRKVVSFASNDYLGLSNHPAVRAAAVEAVERWGAGATSSRLIRASSRGE